MPIFKSTDLQKHISKLNKKHADLIEILKGKTPNPNVFNLYHNNPEQYAEEFIEIDELDVKEAINGFEFILKELKSIKKLKASKIGR